MSTRFYKHRDLELVASVTPQEPTENHPDVRWRLTTWAPNGPTGHTCLSESGLTRELKWYWCEDPGAGKLLDSWVNTPRWGLGVRRCRFVQIWNACSFRGRWDLTRRLDEAGTLDEALAMIPEIRKELGR